MWDHSLGPRAYDVTRQSRDTVFFEALSCCSLATSCIAILFLSFRKLCLLELDTKETWGATAFRPEKFVHVQNADFQTSLQYNFSSNEKAHVMNFLPDYYKRSVKKTTKILEEMAITIQIFARLKWFLSKCQSVEGLHIFLHSLLRLWFYLPLHMLNRFFACPDAHCLLNKNFLPRMSSSSFVDLMLLTFYLVLVRNQQQMVFIFSSKEVVLKIGQYKITNILLNSLTTFIRKL